MVKVLYLSNLSYESLNVWSDRITWAWLGCQGHLSMTASAKKVLENKYWGICLDRSGYDNKMKCHTRKGGL